MNALPLLFKELTILSSTFIFYSFFFFFSKSFFFYFLFFTIRVKQTTQLWFFCGLCRFTFVFYLLFLWILMGLFGYGCKLMLDLCVWSRKPIPAGVWIDIMWVRLGIFGLVNQSNSVKTCCLG